MPSHIYMRTGDFMAAVRSNVRAIEVDEAYLRASGDHDGAYAMMYAPHNVQFLTAAAAMAGRLAEARRGGEQLLALASAHGAEPPPPDMLPMLEAALAQPAFVTLRFQRWDDALAMPEPPAFLPVVGALRHCARGMAFAAARKWKDVEVERAAITAARDALPERRTFGFSPASLLLELAETELRARLATARGDRSGAVAAWTTAVELADRVTYNEPPDWYHPPRESLGAALLTAKRPTDAEAVFRADLERNPRNGRSLFGLWQSLDAQKKTSDAAWVRRQFEKAWRDADVPLRIGDL